jgi:hypothetical protein
MDYDDEVVFEIQTPEWQERYSKPSYTYDIEENEEKMNEYDERYSIRPENEYRFRCFDFNTDGEQEFMSFLMNPNRIVTHFDLLDRVPYDQVPSGLAEFYGNTWYQFQDIPGGHPIICSHRITPQDSRMSGIPSTPLIGISPTGVETQFYYISFNFLYRTLEEDEGGNDSIVTLLVDEDGYSKFTNQENQIFSFKDSQPNPSFQFPSILTQRGFNPLSLSQTYPNLYMENQMLSNIATLRTPNYSYATIVTPTLIENPQIRRGDLRRTLPYFTVQAWSYEDYAYYYG